jgi:uncharacterized protein with GYD domain
VTARQDTSHPLTDRACGRAETVVASLGRLPHAKLHRVLTKEDNHGNLCRAGEVHRAGNPQCQGLPKATDAFKEMAKTFGVTVKDIVWTQGRYDIVTIVEAPDESSAMSLNLSLGALGNVRTETLRAFSAAEMTKIVDKML